MDILVIGSFMMDLVVQTPRSPKSGETIIGSKFSRFLGGKGANQAVAASRLGGNVKMAGKIGKDKFGQEFLTALKSEQIDTSHILVDENNETGIGMVTLEANGDNRIIVVPGANLLYSRRDLEKTEKLIKDSDILVVQLEMDIHMIESAIDIADENNVPVILNPAPAQELNENILSKVTYLTPNETEMEILCDTRINTKSELITAANSLINKGVNNVIITLAEEGALVVNHTDVYTVPGFAVKSVDSVAAGDSFNGALAVGIAKGEPLQNVVEFANAAGALAVTKKGAIPSLPTLEEVVKFTGNKTLI